MRRLVGKDDSEAQNKRDCGDEVARGVKVESFHVAYRASRVYHGPSAKVLLRHSCRDDSYFGFGKGEYLDTSMRP